MNKCIAVPRAKMHFQADDRCTAAAKDLVLLVQWSIPARPAMVPVMPASHVAARAAGVSCAAAAAAVDADLALAARALACRRVGDTRATWQASTILSAYRVQIALPGTYQHNKMKSGLEKPRHCQCASVAAHTICL